MIGSLIGGMIGQGGANTAAGMASGAGNQALAGAQHQQDVNNASSAPWTQTGSKAAQSIAALLGYGGLSGNGAEGSTLQYGNDYNPEMQAAAGNQLRGLYANSGATLPTYMPTTFNHSNVVSDNFTADPSYAWRVSEGNKALDRSAASKGMLLSGAQAKGLTDYNSNVASQEYGNWYNRLDNQNKFNLQGDLSTNNQNFGQQQTLYGDQYGQYTDALNRLYAAAGIGQQSNAATMGLNTSANAQGYNALLQGQTTAGNDYQAGANALASGIGKGINNTLAAGYLFGGGLGGGESSMTPSSIGGMPRDYYTSGGGYTSYGR